MSTESDSADSSHEAPRLGARALLLLLEAYYVTLAPLVGGFCRYTPSCSRYAHEAVRRHGAVRGARLAVLRVLRCHPFHHGGYDPVPQESKNNG